MSIKEIDWVSEFGKRSTFPGVRKAGSEESRAGWNERAKSFAKKKGRSGYVEQVIGMIDLAPGETVFDMGCGNGALAIPFAEAGHDVVAVDFSPVMLDTLCAEAKAKGVDSRIKTFNRSWQEDWSDLPQADVAISSRSFVTEDMADGIAKLEGQAKSRAVLSVGAGDRPFRDARILAAMGREDKASEPPWELMILANYLWSIGRYPRIGYAEYPGRSCREAREELVESIWQMHAPENEAQEEALATYLDEHIVFDEVKQSWSLDYSREDRWGVLIWPIPR